MLSLLSGLTLVPVFVRGHLGESVGVLSFVLAILLGTLLLGTRVLDPCLTVGGLAVLLVLLWLLLVLTLLVMWPVALSLLAVGLLLSVSRVTVRL